MVFGEPTRFGVSVELDEDYGGHMLYGRACYWIGGQQIGDWEGGASLGDVLTAITRFVKDSGCRDNHALFRLSAETAFDRIDVSLYGKEEPAPENFVEFAAPYAVSNLLSVLSGWKVFLVECEGQARLLYRGPTGGVQEFMLNSGEFDKALRATWDQLTAWDEREATSEMP